MEETKLSQSINVTQSAAKKVAVRSAVSYPYFDLTQSIELAKAIHEKGGGSCTPEQLIAFLNYKSIKSGTYQVRLSSAKQFGLVRTDNGVIAVTERAHQILSPIMPEDRVNAQVDAFLSVELFNSIYEQFQGATIPPEVGLKNLLIQKFGFSTDRAGPAVKVLIDSAEQAGFFSAGGRTRLVRPAMKLNASEAKPNEAPAPVAEPVVAEKPKTSADAPAGVHSAIIGLLRELPPPGTQWPKRQKLRFVKAFQATLNFIYPSEEDDEEGDGEQ